MLLQESSAPLLQAACGTRPPVCYSFILCSCPPATNILEKSSLQSEIHQCTGGFLIITQILLKPAPVSLWLSECWLREDLPWCEESETGNFLQILCKSPREPGRETSTFDHAWFLFGWLTTSTWSGRGRGRGGGGGGGRRWWGRAAGCACPSPSPCPAGCQGEQLRRRSRQNLMETPVRVTARLVASVPKGGVVVGCCHLWHLSLVLRFTLPLLSAETLRICSYAGDDQPISSCPMAEKPEPKSLSREH